MTSKINLGIWGAGTWARMSSRAILESKAFNVLACYDPDERNREEFSTETSCAQVDSEEALLDYPDLEAMAIYTPNFLHADQAVRAFERGHHVFVEKPMANTFQESRGMLEAGAKANRVLFVGHNTRREGRFRRIKSLLENEAIGDPVLANMTFTSPAGLKQELGGWRYDKNLCPAVALAQIGVHAIDILHYLFGWTRETQAWIHRVGLEADVDDVCLGRLQHDCGISSILNTAYSVPRARSLQILGTAGEINTVRESMVLLQPMGAEEIQRIEVDEVDTVLEEFQEFAASCRGEKTPETGGKVGLVAAAVMEGMIRSSQSNSIVIPIPMRE